MSFFIQNLRDIRLTDVPEVGGKNASLGEMINTLSQTGIRVPAGFATTAAAYRHFLRYNNLRERLAALMAALDRSGYSNLADIGRQARELIYCAEMPEDLHKAIGAAYRELAGDDPSPIAVRSSATAEDLPDASFAGQHESYLNISGESAVIEAVQLCYASLYTDRAIKYREEQGYAHEKVALSAGVQRMVRSDKGCSGVCFTLEPESGFRNIIHIAGVWGLGENLVQGTVTPDEFLVFKPVLRTAKDPVIRRTLGAKQMTMVFGEGTSRTHNQPTPEDLRDRFVLSDIELKQLADWAMLIETHYGKPMDIEWAKDGLTGDLFIVQARPETVHSRKNPWLVTTYTIRDKGKCLASGEAVGKRIVSGRARVVSSPAALTDLAEGDIIVTDLTSPDWDPLLKRVAAIVTDKGGRTSHASIIARELGVPAIVGTGMATEAIKDKQTITVSCCEGNTGFVYAGASTWRETSSDLKQIRKPEHTRALLIAGDPDQAFELSYYPSDGVGLMRMEFIITHSVQIHPMALAGFDTMKDQEAKKRIGLLTAHYPDKKQFFIDRLSEGIATIAAAFYPREVILRTSDFKTNEYANLLGGREFEPAEENPMLGFRGAARYYNQRYAEGFRMECAAIKRVREDLGLTNLQVMIPFCRTVSEGKKVLEQMRANGLARGAAGLRVYVMAEIPSNVLLAKEFASIFDGFSIGSNDLTQLTLGIDRDSELLGPAFDERDPAAMQMIGDMIRKAKSAGVKVGLCGQAPSDYPEFARFLVEKGIDSISFNSDALLKGIENIVSAEKEIRDHALPMVTSCHL